MYYEVIMSFQSWFTAKWTLDVINMLVGDIILASQQISFCKYKLFMWSRIIHSSRVVTPKLMPRFFMVFMCCSWHVCNIILSREWIKEETPQAPRETSSLCIWHSYDQSNPIRSTYSQLVVLLAQGVLLQLPEVQYVKDCVVQLMRK